MGYDVTTKTHGGNTVYAFAQASDGKFDSAKEVNEFLESKIASESGVLLDFDNDKTARDIFSNMEDGCFKGGGFRLLNPGYWEQLPIDDFVYGDADRHTKPMKFLRDNYYELRNYFSKGKNIEVLNALTIFEAGHITNISGNGDHIEAELKDRDKSIKAEIFFQEEEPADKHAFKIAEKTYLARYVELDGCAIPSRCGNYTFGIVGNEVVCDCYLDGCYWDEFFEYEIDIWDIDDEAESRAGEEAVKAAWRDKYKSKAMNMLRTQLIKDFGEDFCDHVKMYYDTSGDLDNFVDLDNFYINYDEAFFTISFDKKWFAEWCAKNHEKIESRIRKW